MIKQQNYWISGKAYNEEDLTIYAKGKVKNHSTPEWEKDIFRFILDWISPLELLEVHTSGSTGIPRKIEIPKIYFEASAKASVRLMNIKKNGISFLCLPTQYIAGKMMVVRSMVGGLDLHYTEPSSTPDMSKIQKVEFAGMIPMQVAKLLTTEKGQKDLNKIKKLIVGGSFIPTSLEDKVKSLSNEIWATYGMTETITHIALRRLNGPDASDLYTPMPTVKVHLDERGCAVIDAEYIGIKDLVTNDLAQISADGRFRILGRIDNVVMSGGLLLLPEIIEKKLHGFLDQDFFLAGLRDHELGERLVIFIEDPENELEAKEDDIWNILRKKLTGYDIPKSIIFMEEFSRTVSGKILRPNTIENYVAQFDESTEEQ